MKAKDELPIWSDFQAANRFRRAIRHFGTIPIPKDDVAALLAEAVFAPSSGNLQPYQLHWIQDPSLKASIASACHGQKAAASAKELIVVVASSRIGRQTAMSQLAHIETSSTLGEGSKDYLRKHIRKFQKILGIGSSVVWSPILFIAALIRPTLSLLPIGHIGSCQWAARNAIFAAQTLMLGAAAKGIDSCPMEGFSATEVAKLLRLPKGTVIPLIIALGYRARDARIEQQWRRPLSDIVITH